MIFFLVFAFQSQNLIIPDELFPPDDPRYPLQPAMPCECGWKLVFWFYLCGTDMCPGNFPIFIGAGALNNAQHPLESISPADARLCYFFSMFMFFMFLVISCRGVW